jgi:uncharacterized protein
MRYFKSILTIGITIMLCNHSFGQSNYVSNIAKYRDSIDIEFKDSSTSILLLEDRKDFDGLHYFSISESWVLNAKFRRAYFSRPFEMQTSTKRMPMYKKYGTLVFRVGDQKVKMIVYQNVALSESEGYKDYLFCPFRDETAPKESYGGGRYLDFKKQDLSRHCKIDFNMSYNPYCAYNYRYSCPIPPKKNHLKVRIEAGIKKWH